MVLSEESDGAFILVWVIIQLFSRYLHESIDIMLVKYVFFH